MTDTGAKSKSFWRRRRRKSSEPAVAEPAAGSAVAAEPADKTEPAAAGESTSTDGSSEKAAADQSAEPKDADVPAEPNESTSGADDKSSEDAEPSADAVVESSGDDESEEDRPAVGVTYEPEESPDGFPLEYGEIIVGLPKGGEVPESERMVDPRVVAADVPADDAKSAEPDKSAAEIPSPAVVAADTEETAAEGSKETAEGAPVVEDAESEEAAPAGDAADETVEEKAPAEAEDEAPAVADDVPETVEAAAATEKDSDDEDDSEKTAAAEAVSADDTPAASDEADSEATETDSAEVDTDATEQPDDAEPEEEPGDAEPVEEPDDAEPVEELSPEATAAKAAEEQAAMALITALMKLRGALADSKLPLDVVGADEARQQRKAMLDQLDDYVLPRLVQLEAPVLAVVGGSTGAGKSTLVNSLIGEVVSEPGVLRPTTRSPVLIHHPADAEWFAGDRVLPGMARSSGNSPGGMEDPGQIRLVAADTIPRGLAILDAPDIDSVVEANRELATQLLAAADLWLFVTTAARYADAVPWEFLQSASDRSTAVAVVLDRAPADTIDDITGHLAQMLLERGLGDSPLFSIKETVVDERGMLPGETVASIKDWLIDLAADAEARSAVVRRTLQGAVTAMTKKTPAFSKAVRAQADTFDELRTTAETAYERAVKDIAKATQDGTMLRGEVLARWQEFVGTGELLKGLQTNVGRLRDKVRSAVVGKPPPTRDLNDAVESGLESLLREHAEAAAERAEESWQSTAAGRQLLAAGDRDLGRMSKEFPAAASRAVREWQGFVLELVRKEGADKRSTARILAYGVNGLGLSLMIVIFASTAGITGAEVGVGAGTAVVGQKLLEAVFGDQAVRTLAAKARQDLEDRVQALMDAEFARYLAVLDQHPVDPEAPRQLTEAARAVEDCT
ncbi:dynamin family protein [Kribbella sp. ALI-6-A]|uniref:dynamin family protein n=1 Tax=Kribbella sp. ALI-6-A TaxID=1933817 RepID=UPI000A06FB2B|nr:dynamin family protein [Kribbella sp. ALI-6-A]